MNQENQAIKKGLHPLAWVGIGCGALALLAFLAVVAVVGFGLFKAREVMEDFEENPAKTTAETVIKLNPGLEHLTTDEEAGTVTFKDKKSGEIATFNFEDIAEGKFQITTEEGTFSLDADGGEDGGSLTIEGPEGTARYAASSSLEEVPDWVPLYPGARGAAGSYSATTAEGVSGIVSGQTGDGAEEVIGHYKTLFEDQGWEIRSQSSTTTQEATQAAISGELPGEGRRLDITAGEQGGETQVMIHYNAKPGD